MSAHKLMLLGEIGVGKSSLARRLVFDKFDTQYTPTIGVDIYTYALPREIGGAESSLIIWDTDGSFGNAIFRHVYLKEAAGALIVGDVTRRGSLDAMLELSKGFATALPGRHVGFVVNKLDLLLPGEEPDLPAGLRRADIDLTLASALTGDHVKEAFHRAAAAIRRRGH